MIARRAARKRRAERAAPHGRSADVATAFRPSDPPGGGTLSTQSDQPRPSGPEGPDTVVLVHGLWMTPRSWEHWVPHFEARGYRVLTPGYPGFEVEVEAAGSCTDK